MNIQTVRIKNFRSYQGNNLFDLSKRVTILYGPNGYGKSSFFDAVEWCLTGLISRFNNKKFDPKTSINLYADANTESLVEIKFDGNTLIRKYDVIDGEPKASRVKILLANGKAIIGQQKVDSFLKNQHFTQSGTKNPFVGLVKQSHILSQDQVTEFVLQDDKEARFSAMADIMGLKQVWVAYQNLSEINSKMKLEITKKEKKIEDINSRISTEKNRLIQIETFDSSLLQDIFKLEEPIAIRKEIQRQKTSMNRKIRHSKEIHEGYDTLRKKFGYGTLRIAKEDVMKIDKSLKHLTFLTSGYQELKKNVDKLFTALSKQERRFQRISELESNLKASQIQLIKQKASLKLGNKTTIELIDEFRELSVKIDYALVYRDMYFQLIEKEKSLPLTKLNLDRKLLRFARHQNRLTNFKSNILTELNHNNEETISKYIAAFESIMDYVRKNDLQDECPVCGYKHGEQLVDQLNRGVESTINSLSTDANRIQKLHSLLNRIEKSSQLLKESIKEDEQQSRELRLRQTEVRRQIDELTGVASFDLELFNQNEEVLTNNNLTTKEKIQRLNDSLKLEETINKLESQIKNETNLLGPFRVTSNTNKRISNLRKAELRINQRLLKLQSEQKQLNDKFSSLTRLLKLADESDYPEEMEIEKLLSILILEIKTAEDEFGILEKGESLNNSLEFNQKIEKEILRIEVNLNKFVTQNKKYENAVASIDKHLKETALSIGTEIVDMLNSERVPVQRYFRYLNPLPSQTPLVFADEGEKLNIMVKLDEKKEASTARYTLSSGQLNVLAISLFLAMNESQNVSILDFLAIDDPIQNMDDVNRFSVCDVLGRLNKQLIFSTHDLDFVKLFVKKNQYQKSDIQVYMLKSPYESSELTAPVQFD